MIKYAERKMLEVRKTSDLVIDMCEMYCKFPDKYTSNFNDIDTAFDKMEQEKCVTCPVLELERRTWKD